MFPEGLPPKVLEKIDEIANLFEEGRLKIFCGAGISVNPPSNLPSGKALVNKIIDTLRGDHPIPEELREKIEKMQFEAFVEDIERNTSEYSSLLYTLTKLFSTGRPNKNHYLIAHLMACGHLQEVMTTNFDTKIEDAVQKLKTMDPIPEQRELQTFYDEEELLRASQGDSSSPVLYKIHGTITDEKSIRTTLEYVSSSVLLEKRTEVVRCFFDAGDAILVLGYGGLDHFDVNPVIQKIKAGSRVIRVLREKRGRDAGVWKLCGPFSGFEGYTICVPFDGFVDYLLERLGRSFFEEGEWNDEWKGHVDDWGESIFVENKYYSLGSVLLLIRECDEARNFYEEAKAVSEKLGNLWGVAASLHQMASTRFFQSEYIEARALYRQSLEIKERIGDQIGVALTLHQLAIIHQNRGEYNEARELYERALAVFEKLRNQSRMAAALHQLAMIHEHQGEYEKARSLYRQSLEINERIGDQRGVALTLHQLAIIHRLNFEYDDARKLFERVIAVFERLGDQIGEASTITQLGIIHDDQGEHDKARELYEQSLEMSERLGDQRGVADTLHQMAIALFVQGEYIEARALYRQSLEINERLGDQRGVAGTLHQLAIIHGEQGEYDEAKKLFKQSLEIKERLGDQNGVAITLCCLGLLYVRQNNKQEAERYLIEANRIFKSIDHKEYTYRTEKMLKAIRDES